MLLSFFEVAVVLIPFSLGHHRIDTPIALAPMAGVTDKPFRQLCRDFGAGYTVAEMLASDTSLWHTQKSSKRLDYSGEGSPRAIQIVGYDPQMMAEAARQCVERGAEIIDINMGCPAKKVCNRLAGSALLQDESLVAQILTSVVNAVSVPVTLKTRTGWHPEHRNGVKIAQIAEDAGIQMLVMHGRTRADKYLGEAEYDTIAAVKQSVKIPVLANGDIYSVEKAKKVLVHTGCNGIMLGRAAHGQPWIFRELKNALTTPHLSFTKPSLEEQMSTVLEHLSALHEFYGEFQGLRFARKHFTWYAQCGLALDDLSRKQLTKGFHQLETPLQQLNFVRKTFEQMIESKGLAA